MRPTTHEPVSSARRVPKSFVLLRAAIALPAQCAREIVENVDAPDLAATGDWIERIEEERRSLAAATEDYLRRTLLSQFDPADLHGLSANIAMLTHRSTRAVSFFNMLGSTPAVEDLRGLTTVFARCTTELVAIVTSLDDTTVRLLSERVHVVRRLRDEARLHTDSILTMTPANENIVLWQTVGQAIDAATAQGLAVGEESLRVATKHD